MLRKLAQNIKILSRVGSKFHNMEGPKVAHRYVCKRCLLYKLEKHVSPKTNLPDVKCGILATPHENVKF